MRVIFMGSPDFSVPVLDALVEAGHEIACVYCQPPRPAGRGKRDRPTAVQSRAEGLGLPVRHPITLRDEATQREFTALDADVAVVVAYGLILPQPILDAPRHGCLNIHASLLPRWRGAAPIHRAIMAGDRKTGVCIMQMEAGLDTGPVLMSQSVDIGTTETSGELHDRLSQLGSVMIVDALARLGNLVAVPQAADGVTYAEKIDKAEARIDWTGAAERIAQKINGLSPFPGAWADAGGERVKVLRARPTQGNGHPGQVLGRLTIACGSGAVEVLDLQRAGRKAMPTSDALRGWDDLPDRFG